jgi:group II intron reverse transcriptase/maturase
MESRMKEPYTEGLASHGDPESCAGAREGAGEALTGAHTGGVLSRETNKDLGADDVVLIGRQHTRVRKGECTGDLARSEASSMCGNSMRENREIPCSAREDGKTGDGERTESSWSRVPRDEKCGEDDPRPRSPHWLGTVSDEEPRRLSRNEQKRLVLALRIALSWSKKKGAGGEAWGNMLYEANLGLEPQELWRMRNLLKAIVGYDPLEADPSPKTEKPASLGGSDNRRSPSPTLARAGKAGGRNPAMHGHGKSDRPIVPAKLSNKAGQPAAEAVEGRGLTKENADQRNTLRTQSRESCVSNALDRVRQAALRRKKERFSALFHHITIDRLRDAFFKIKKSAAPGVDGVTWEQYEEDLEENLHDLHDRLHRGAYRAKPSRRTYIPKSDGRQRPLGIATLEDKISQRAVAEVLNAIYEVDFLGFSYGFRPGRCAHEALDALAVGIRHRKISWILDADIRGYFDAINHEWLMKFLEHRIADRRMLRLIKKWLTAGVIEDGVWSANEEGSPQGASISPLLANVYLHYVLDLWVQRWRKHVARGDVVIVRWADDFVVGFQYGSDARRFLEELRDRFRKFSLELHPEKTRLIRFGRFARQDIRRDDGKKKPETFDFLGFTHYCGVNRNGKFQVGRITMKKRLTAKLHEIKAELRKRMHQKIVQQGLWLKSVIRGYFAYHAIPGNFDALRAFRTQVERLWHRILRRRSQKTRLTWDRMKKYLKTWIPRARIIHPWPEQRYVAIIQGRSRMS